jgi:hypothetical protein
LGRRQLKLIVNKLFDRSSLFVLDLQVLRLLLGLLLLEEFHAPFLALKERLVRHHVVHVQEILLILCLIDHGIMLYEIDVVLLSILQCELETVRPTSLLLLLLLILRNDELVRIEILLHGTLLLLGRLHFHLIVRLYLLVFASRQGFGLLYEFPDNSHLLALHLLQVD